MEEYKKKNVPDLMKLLDEKREVVRAARFDRSGAAKKKGQNVSLAKKEIARILTEQSARAKVGNTINS